MFGLELDHGVTTYLGNEAYQSIRLGLRFYSEMALGYCLEYGLALHRFRL